MPHAESQAYSQINMERILVYFTTTHHNPLDLLRNIEIQDRMVRDPVSYLISTTGQSASCSTFFTTEPSNRDCSLPCPCLPITI